MRHLLIALLLFIPFLAIHTLILADEKEKTSPLVCNEFSLDLDNGRYYVLRKQAPQQSYTISTHKKWLVTISGVFGPIKEFDNRELFKKVQVGDLLICTDGCCHKGNNQPAPEVQILTAGFFFGFTFASK